MTPKQTRDDERANRLAGFIKAELAAMENRIQAAVGQKPDRWIDRKLMGIVRSKWTHWWVFLYTLFAVVLGAAIQAVVSS